MDIEEALHQVQEDKAFITVTSAEEKQALMDLCSEYWRPAAGCSATLWELYPHLIKKDNSPTFSCGNAKVFKACGKIQYLFKELIEQPIDIDTSELL